MSKPTISTRPNRRLRLVNTCRARSPPRRPAASNSPSSAAASRGREGRAGGPEAALVLAMRPSRMEAALRLARRYLLWEPPLDVARAREGRQRCTPNRRAGGGVHTLGSAPLSCPLEGPMRQSLTAALLQGLEGTPMAEAKGSMKPARRAPGRVSRLRLLEERVEKLERMLRVRAPAPPPPPPLPQGPRR